MLKKNENMCLAYLGKVMEGQISESFMSEVIPLLNFKIGYLDRVDTLVLKHICSLLLLIVFSSPVLS